MPSGYVIANVEIVAFDNNHVTVSASNGPPRVSSE